MTEQATNRGLAGGPVSPTISLFKRVDRGSALQHLRFEKQRQRTLLWVVLHQRLAKVKLLPM
jgi:hypothetical protein